MTLVCESLGVVALATDGSNQTDSSTEEGSWSKRARRYVADRTDQNGHHRLAQSWLSSGLGAVAAPGRAAGATCPSIPSGSTE